MDVSQLASIGLAVIAAISGAFFRIAEVRNGRLVLAAARVQASVDVRNALRGHMVSRKRDLDRTTLRKLTAQLRRADAAVLSAVLDFDVLVVERWRPRFATTIVLGLTGMLSGGISAAILINGDGNLNAVWLLASILFSGSSGFLLGLAYTGLAINRRRQKREIKLETLGVAPSDWTRREELPRR